MNLIEIKVPDIGDFKEVEIIEVLVKVGDFINVEQSLITVESDKASMEIPSSQAGVLKELKVKLGDKISEGSLLAILESSAEIIKENKTEVTEIKVESLKTEEKIGKIEKVENLPKHEPSNNLSLGKLPHASPSIRKFARELGVDLTQLNGSGNKGRITLEDVQNFVKKVLAGETQNNLINSANSGAGLNLLPWPKIDFTKFGEIEVKELSRIKKISGANLARNWAMIPHVTNNDEADITCLEKFRVKTNKENEKSGIKITMLAFVIKATVSALQKFPEFNSSLDNDNLIYKKYFNIGFAADTPNGLVVPVLKDADKKGILQISQEMSELAKKAREGKLGIDGMQGGCFSISSLGGIGGTHFTPIINAPEVAILGLSKSQTKPIWDGEKFIPRLILPLSLSYDHRVIDGALAARFNSYLAKVLSDYRRILL